SCTWSKTVCDTFREVSSNTPQWKHTLLITANIVYEGVNGDSLEVVTMYHATIVNS
ncbi:hypothetical protein KXW63_000592, partial [Aspergillus fumigatus]